MEWKYTLSCRYETHGLEPRLVRIICRPITTTTVPTLGSWNESTYFLDDNTTKAMANEYDGSLTAILLLPLQMDHADESVRNRSQIFFRCICEPQRVVVVFEYSGVGNNAR